MKVKTNFLQIPNKAFELLTNDADIVGYQKLLRVVGIGETWSKGNRALAAKLNMSYGKFVRLKQVLQKNGFIEVLPGDSFHSEPDKVKLIDIFDYKEVEEPLSKSGHPLSKSGQHIGIISSVPNGTGDNSPSDKPSLSETEISVSRRIWKDGVDLLMKDGKSGRQARAFLGKLAKDFSNELLAECIAVTQAKNPAEVESFLVAVLKTRSKQGNVAAPPLPKSDDVLKRREEFQNSTPQTLPNF